MKRCFHALILLAASCWTYALADDPPAAAKVLTSTATGMKLNWIRTGGFEMGSLTSEEGHTRNEHQHIARITQPFYIGATEVTQGEFETVLERNPSAFSKTGSADSLVSGVVTKQHPVDSVSWFDAVEFCNVLSEKEKLKPYYNMTEIEREGGEKGPIQSAVVTVVGGSGYRLPTEAEWEYACRAGTTTAYSTGDTVRLLRQTGWYGGVKTAGNSEGRTHRVAQKAANDFGLYDMHGNVSEWCQDWYDYYSYDRSPLNDPTGPPGGSERVVRGGSWNDEPANCRAAYRGASAPKTRNHGIGFRVARAMPVAIARKFVGVPPYRLVIDLRDGGTVDVYNNETYDTIDDAKDRLARSKFVGRITNIRIIDSNGDQVE